MIDKLIEMTLAGKADSDQHTLTLFSIALSVRAKRILELGVREGNSTLPLLYASTVLDGMTTSVDCCDTSFTPGTMAAHWQFIKAQSLAYLEDCVAQRRRFDLIFVDDCHAYGHVKRELALIGQLANLNTVILLHDLMAPYTQPFYTPQDKWQGEWAEGGPQRAVQELDPEIWEWATIPVSNGLTLLRKHE